VKHLILSKASSLCVLMSVSLLSACGQGGGDGNATEEQNIARAQLLGPENESLGEAIVGNGDDGLIVQIRAEGLSAGQHGVHLHAIGTCEGPDFKSAGGHWNPDGKEHGLDNPKGSHKGDFPNLDIGEDGKGSLEAVVPGVSLSGDKNPLLDEDGSAIVIHAGPDDLKSDPSGNSGGRVACGVLTLQ